MRKAFINTIIELSEQDKDIWLLTADMGFGLVEQFAKRFPKQYINVGVAEQNMIGIATGLALEGKKVFCYSIANFPTLRCLEQIRNDACYHKANVNIINGGAGLWYGELGSSHHSTEDISIMRSLPNMTVVSPANPSECRLAVRELINRLGPSYLRMTRSKGDSEVKDYQIGRARKYDGEGITLITTGSMLELALKVREETGCHVLSVHTIKPIDKEAIIAVAVETGRVVTIEEHNLIGGLGSAVIEVLSDAGVVVPVKRIGIRDEYFTKALSYEELLKANHLDVDSIIKEVVVCAIK